MLKICVDLTDDSFSILFHSIPLDLDLLTRSVVKVSRHEIQQITLSLFFSCALSNCKVINYMVLNRIARKKTIAKASHERPKKNQLAQVD